MKESLSTCCAREKCKVMVMSLMVFSFALFLLANSVYADSQEDIVAQAVAAVAAAPPNNIPLGSIISNAFNEAAASGIPFEDMSAALAEALMDAAMQRGTPGMTAVYQISGSVLGALTAAGTDEATALRTISGMVQGIRAAADRTDLDSDAVRNGIISFLTAAPGGGELATQLAQVVDAAYSQPHAETYTNPPTPPVAKTPPPPPSTMSPITPVIDAKPSKP